MDRMARFERAHTGSSPVRSTKFLLKVRLMVRHLAVNQTDVGSSPMPSASLCKCRKKRVTSLIKECRKA